MKKISLFLLFLLVNLYPQSATSSLLEVREIQEMGFEFIDGIGVTSNAYEFLYLGNDKFFLSGNYKYSQSPDYYNCVAYVNFETGMIWKHMFFIGSQPKTSNLSKVVAEAETSLTATSDNGLNFYSVSGEIIKTISGLNGYKIIFPFYDNGLVVTLGNSKVYAHKINFETGVLGDSFFVASSVTWIEDVKEYNGNIFFTIIKPDGGVYRTQVVKLNENGIVWQSIVDKVGPSFLAVTSNIIYVVGDSVTSTGVTSKLIALDSNGVELWRRSFKYELSNNQTMTLSRSIIINPFNSDCVIGGYVADPGSTAYINSWNHNGEKLWEYVDGSSLAFNLRKILWNESLELVVCGGGDDGNGNYQILIKKYFIPDITTDIPNETPSPTSFTLEQNYPNPFNPSTTIVFTIPVEARVTLKVYDVLGKEVATLINESNHPVGTHKVSFDGQNLPSGVYFYKLNTPEYSLTKKMVYCK